MQSANGPIDDMCTGDPNTQAAAVGTPTMPYTTDLS